jgi:hypothetical protein
MRRDQSIPNKLCHNGFHYPQGEPARKETADQNALKIRDARVTHTLTERKRSPMATAKQKAHRAKFARAARAKRNTAVGRKAKSTERQRKKR